MTPKPELLFEQVEVAFRDGYAHVVNELLANIKRTAIRLRNSDLSKNSTLDTADHIENLADEALAYFTNATPAMTRESKER